MVTLAIHELASVKNAIIYETKFSPTFLFYSIEVYDPLIRNFRVWASDKRVRIFSRASKCDIPRAVKICKLVHLTS